MLHTPNISDQFFPTIPELSTIQKSFPLSQINEQLSCRDLETEFELLRALTETKKHKLRLRTNSIMESKKNRYPEQSIYEHSRILLTPNEAYINANYIPSPIVSSTSPTTIISQAPLQETVADMFHLIRQQRITCVVMLCNVIENGKVRCYDYLGQSDLCQVQVMQGNWGNGIQLRKVVIKGKQEEGDWDFLHLWYTEWPDRGIPTTTVQLHPLLTFMQSHYRLLIHCSAGLGRSGVIAAIYKISKEVQDGEMSVFKTVREMREWRYGAVQNSMQYKFIYEYFRDFVQEGWSHQSNEI